MQFERKHFMYILIALVLSLTAMAQDQTISSELGNYTELNSSRIFRIWDTSTSEILLYEDGLYLNHANGGINEVKITATNTEFMRDIDMAGNNINNCGNCGGSDNLTWQNSKVNKTGDNMTGILQVNNTITSLRLRVFDTNRTVPISEKPQSTDDLIIEKQNTNQMRMLSWGNTTGAGNYFGAGVYAGNYNNPLPTSSTPWLFAAFGDAYDGVGATSSMTYAAAFGMKTTGTWNSTFHGGQMVFYTRKPTNTLNTMIMGDDGNITLSSSVGTGYRFACWDSTGKLFQSDVSCDLI